MQLTPTSSSNRRSLRRTLALATMFGTSITFAAPAVGRAVALEHRPVGVPCAPVAVGVAYLMEQDEVLNGNDVLAYSTTCGLAVYFGEPSSGEFDGLPDGSFTFIPVPGFTGVVTIPFGFVDMDATATIEIHVEPAVCEVVLADDNYATLLDTPLSVAAPAVAANDPATCGLGFELVSPTTSGTLTFDADGSFAYTPDAGFTGVDSFQYRTGRAPVGLHGPTAGFRGPRGAPAPSAPATVTIVIEAPAPTTTTPTPTPTPTPTTPTTRSTPSTTTTPPTTTSPTTTTVIAVLTATPPAPGGTLPATR